MTGPAYTLSVLRDSSEAATVRLRWFRRIDSATVADINKCLADLGVELLRSPVGPGWLLNAATVHSSTVAGEDGQLELEGPGGARLQRVAG